MFNPVRYFNKYTMQSWTPTVLTGLAFGGVVATGVTSAMAVKLYERYVEEGCSKKVAFLKAFWIPALVGTGTIASFAAVRRADKAMLSGLSIGAAEALNRIEERVNPEFDPKYVYADVVIDDDGTAYYDPVSDIFIKMTPETFQAGINKMNNNLQIRGLGSLYELYRMWGLKKVDILRLCNPACKYIGWHWTEMCEDKGFFYLNVYATRDHNDILTIYIEDCFVPICCNPPQCALDYCNCDQDDVDEYELEQAEDIVNQIETEIYDEGVE